MNITEIRVKAPRHASTNTQAFVSMTVDNFLVVHGIKIVKGTKDDKLLVFMPNHKGKDGVYRDTVHPISNDEREKLEEEILNAYFEWSEKYQNDNIVPDKKLIAKYNIDLARQLHGKGEMSLEDFTKICSQIDSEMNKGNIEQNCN